MGMLLKSLNDRSSQNYQSSVLFALINYAISDKNNKWCPLSGKLDRKFQWYLASEMVEAFRISPFLESQGTGRMSLKESQLGCGGHYYKWELQWQKVEDFR